MARKSLTEKRRLEALGDELRGLYRALVQRVVPDRLASVVEQLDEGEGHADRKARDRRG
jgi:hypothetical protein